ncbi:MAG: hypothetical protein NWE81_02840 [Candidatus Bathyarchaeota archaeon]|nr:hypothetical protein [Candidatus Bathyarchaeota archaeon]
MDPENAREIAIDFVKKSKNVVNVNLITTERKDGFWVVKGTCPIDLSGHPWRETFEIRIDQKGKIKGSSFWLM